MHDIDVLINKHFPTHPFSMIPPHANFSVLLANYLAMSQAFPYLQAGSQGEIFFEHMERNEDIPEQVELTTVVGNFLCWDETGGLNLTLATGLKALPRLLETKRFHANLFKQDCVTLLGSPLPPDYSELTKIYLYSLYKGLSAACPITRVANMVAFEAHAHHMIDALWESVAAQFNVPKNKLAYFAVHVGGDDPAEPYHVEMTNLLIEKVIPKESMALFYDKLVESYQLNSQWCADVVSLSCNNALAA